MEIDTRARIYGTVKITDIIKALRKAEYITLTEDDIIDALLQLGQLHNKNTEHECRLCELHFESSLDENNKHRHLAIFLPIGYNIRLQKQSNDDHAYVELAIRHCGNSVKIIEDLLQFFGGEILDNDCDGEWQYIAKLKELN